MHNLLRLFVIARVLWPEFRAFRRYREAKADDAAPARLADRLIALGPAFIKLGQVLSTRPEMMPPAYIEALSQLQEHVPEVPLDTIFATIQTQFGKPVDQLFAAFEPKPVAAASLAQVHRAVRFDGTIVAVKVQRPDLERLVGRDLDAVQGALDWLGFLFPRRLKRMGVREFFSEFRRYTLQELDFSHEGHIADRMRANLGGRTDVKIPAVDWDRTGRHVLTLGWVEGIRLQEASKSFDVVTRQLLVTRLVEILLQMFVSDGLFHADLHSGNIVFHPDGTFTLLDFGMYGELNLRQRDRFVLYWFAVVQHQTRRAFHHFKAQTRILPGTDEAAFFARFETLSQRFYTSRLSEISFARVYFDMMRAGYEFGFVFPSELMLHAKALTTAEALIFVLAPDARFEQLSRPFIAREYAARVGSVDLLRRRFTQMAPELLLIGEMLPAEALDDSWDRQATTALFSELRDRLGDAILRALGAGELWKSLVAQHAETAFRHSKLAASVGEILDDSWKRYYELEPSVPVQPTLGAVFTTHAAALILALHETLVARGVSAAESHRLIYDTAWGIYQQMGKLPEFIAAAFTRDPQKRLQLATDMFRSFPFGAPSYGWRDVPRVDGVVGFDCIKCPVAKFLVGHDASELCVETICKLDYPLAEMWGGRLERTRTISAGADHCDFRWHADAGHSQDKAGIDTSP